MNLHRPLIRAHRTNLDLRARISGTLASLPIRDFPLLSFLLWLTGSANQNIERTGYRPPLMLALECEPTNFGGIACRDDDLSVFRLRGAVAPDSHSNKSSDRTEESRLFLGSKHLHDQ